MSLSERLRAEIALELELRGVDVDGVARAPDGGLLVIVEESVRTADDDADLDDGAALTWTVLGGGAGTYGTLSVDQDGVWTYRLANETGGRAFFQGSTGFVTFDSYFDRFRETLNRQYARAR